MSVAFRRDSDEEPQEPRFELPIPAGPNLVTSKGLSLIEARVAELEAAVAGEGDAMRLAEAKRSLRYWRTRLATAQLMPPPPEDEVGFGSRVSFVIKGTARTIDIVGDEKEMRKRVMSIVTDSVAVDAPKDPATSTIFKLYSVVASKDEIADMRERFVKGGTGYGDFKKQLFEKLWEYFAPMRKHREEILKDKSYIDDVLARGARRANEIANQVMGRVRKAVGLR